MSDLETGIETILDSRDMRDPDKVKAISNLIKDVKPDEFIRVIKSHLALDIGDEKIIKQIATFVDSRREKNANQQQYEIKRRQIDYEVSRPWGSERVRFDDRDRYHDRSGYRGGPEDECRCDACGLRCNICCCVPMFLRAPIIKAAQYGFTTMVVLLVIRWAWFNLFRL